MHTAPLCMHTVVTHRRGHTHPILLHETIHLFLDSLRNAPHSQLYSNKQLSIKYIHMTLRINPVLENIYF